MSAVALGLELEGAVVDVEVVAEAFGELVEHLMTIAATTDGEADGGSTAES